MVFVKTGIADEFRRAGGTPCAYARGCITLVTWHTVHVDRLLDRMLMGSALRQIVDIEYLHGMSNAKTLKDLNFQHGKH
jgi:hypothetical protein